MKEEIQAKIRAKTKGMSSVEIMGYFNESAQKSALWQRLAARDDARENAKKQNRAV
jgi:hypothetical protein